MFIFNVEYEVTKFHLFIFHNAASFIDKTYGVLHIFFDRRLIQSQQLTQARCVHELTEIFFLHIAQITIMHLSEQTAEGHY